MSEFLTPLLSAWFDTIWCITWQGTLVILIALLVDYLWKSMPPSWRSWLWRLAFLKIALVILPLSFQLPLLPARAEPPLATSTQASLWSDAPISAIAVDASHSSIPHGKLLLFLIWLVGLIACGISSWEGGNQVRKQLQRSTSILPGSLLMQQVIALRRELGLTIIPEVRLVPGSSSPCLLARRKRSIILLPKEWLESCSMSELRLTLAHELAHLVRADLAWNRFLVWCRAALFFHPFVWIATRRYLLSQEMACDRIAIENSGGNRADFARLLVQLAEHASATPVSAVAMIGSTSSLKLRIASMYQSHYQPTKLIAWAVAAIGVLSLMPWSLAEQVEQDERDQSAVEETDGQRSISASASASSRGSGFANGMGAGGGMGRGNSDGNGRGFGFGGAMTRSRAQARGNVSVSISDGSKKNAIKPKARSRTAIERSSRMAQSMTSRINRGKEAWTRTTEATLNGDNVTIVEQADQISLSIEHPDGTEEVFVANDLRDLASQSRQAAAIYRRLLTPASSTRSNARIGASTRNGMPLNAIDLLRQQIESMKEEQGSQDSLLDSMLDELDALEK